MTEAEFQPTRPLPRLQVTALLSPHGGPFDLAIEAGGCVAIVGRSGSGKSVLLRLIADLDLHSGDASLDGRSRSTWTGPQWRRQVVYQAAEPAWWSPTVRAHLGPDTSGARSVLLSQLDLTEAMLDADIARLSTGERQRMALLRSLDAGPSVLLLDEPTASLDPVSALAVEAVLCDRLRQGLVIVIVTHSREQAERLGHRVLEVRDKRLNFA